MDIQTKNYTVKYWPFSKTVEIKSLFVPKNERKLHQFQFKMDQKKKKRNKWNDRQQLEQERVKTVKIIIIKVNEKKFLLRQ